MCPDVPPRHLEERDEANVALGLPKVTEYKDGSLGGIGDWWIHLRFQVMTGRTTAGGAI